MFEIANERKQFWQWDMGQRLIVGDDVCSEVHFCNGTDECSLVCGVYEEEGQRFVNVPNILFQTAKIIKVFAYIRDADERYTEYRQAFVVLPRTRPADYVYTETETLSYATLEKRIAELEKNPVETEIYVLAEGETLADAPEEAEVVIDPNAEDEDDGGVEIDDTLTQEGKAADAKAVGDALADKVGTAELTTAVNDALAQAKESGEFDGAPGDDYVLTDEDKTEIAQEAAALVDVALLDIIGTGEVTA